MKLKKLVARILGVSLPLVLIIMLLVPAVVFAGTGESIMLVPATATNNVGTEHTVTATVQNAGAPVVGRDVTFEIISGPHAGTKSTVATNENGQATFTYTGTSTGTDVIVASFIDSNRQTQTSAEVTKVWQTGTETPPVEVGGDVYPVNRIIILTPWLVLAIVIAVGTTILIRRRQNQS
jgi:hypothetical protein